jgi:uncharacterized SAM-binding protein YcdF (DUF218 family)
MSTTKGKPACEGCENWARRRRCRRRGLWVLLIGLATFTGAGFPVYVHPRTDPLQTADAIVILAGYGDAERRAYGFSLHEEGWAPNVVLSNPSDRSQPRYSTMMIDRWCSNTDWGVGPESTSTREARGWPPATKFCPNPQPPTTLGEARALRELAAQHGWHSVIVVTSRPHVARARMIFERCFQGDVVMSASPVRIPPDRWVYEYVYQTMAFFKALLTPAVDC